jgi:hypothetical protein
MDSCQLFRLGSVSEVFVFSIRHHDTSRGPSFSPKMAEAFVRSLFVLLTTLSFLLPLWEAFLRKSAFWVILFAALLVSSFTVHCEETGVCSPYPASTHARLLSFFSTLNLFMLNSMLLVVLEVKGELRSRVVVGIWALLAALRDPSDIVFNIPTSVALGVVLLAIDSWAYARRFTPAYWRRLALIASLAAVGAGLFSLLKLLSFSHGIWHLYLATGAYLLLLAQRHKRALAAARSASRHGGNSGGSGHSSSAQHGRGTPLKRGKGGGNIATAIGADAPSTESDTDSQQLV